jgi:hypothetical protein
MQLIACQNLREETDSQRKNSKVSSRQKESHTTTTSYTLNYEPSKRRVPFVIHQTTDAPIIGRDVFYWPSQLHHAVDVSAPRTVQKKRMEDEH